MTLETGLFIFKKLWALFTAFFWKNKRIIYLNSNKKTFNLDKACEDKSINVKDAKVIVLGKELPVSHKRYKAHFKRMQFRLYQIKRNLKNNTNLTYGGFVSPMFAVFDGMQIGNTINPVLVCYDNNTNIYYEIPYIRKSSNSPEAIEDKEDYKGSEINIVISSTYKITSSKYNSNLKTFEFEKIENNQITNEYLEEVYKFVESILVWTQTRNIQKIHLYVAAKQPISFIIGTCIEERHPEIIVYEYINNRYEYALNLKSYKIQHVV